MIEVSNEILAKGWNHFNNICNGFNCKDCPIFSDCEFIKKKRNIGNKLWLLRYETEREQLNEKLL